MTKLFARWMSYRGLGGIKGAKRSISPLCSNLRPVWKTSPVAHKINLWLKTIVTFPPLILQEIEPQNNKKRRVEVEVLKRHDFIWGKKDFGNPVTSILG